MQSARTGFARFAAYTLTSALAGYGVWLLVKAMIRADWAFFALVFIAHAGGLWIGKFAPGDRTRLVLVALALTMGTTLALIVGVVAGAVCVGSFFSERVFAYGATVLGAASSFLLMAWAIWRVSRVQVGAQRGASRRL